MWERLQEVGTSFHVDHTAVIVSFRYTLQSCADLDPEQYPEPLSVSSIEGYRNALVHEHKYRDPAFQIPMSTDVDNMIKKTIKGYKSLVNTLRKKGLMKQHEGLQKVTVRGYRVMAEKLFKAGPSSKGNWSQALFPWIFQIIMWNLACRPDSADTLMICHIEWGDDCLLVEASNKQGPNIYMYAQ
jgi:hypothetical protein